MQLEKNVKKEEKDKIKLQNQILHLTAKLRGKESLMEIQTSKSHTVKQQVESLKNEIYNLKDFIQNPNELKKRVKVSFKDSHMLFFRYPYTLQNITFLLQELLSKYTTDKEAGH